MSTYAIKVTHAGGPLEGVEVVGGEAIYGTTDANGRVEATLDRSTPFAAQVVVSGALPGGGTFEQGGGPHILRPGEDLVVEV